MKNEVSLEYIFERLSRWGLLLTIGISLLSLAGWATGLPVIASIKPGYVPVAPSTVFCFCLLDLPLLLYLFRPDSPARRKAAGVSAFVVLTACSIVLVSSFFGVRFEIEHLGLPADMSIMGVGLIPKHYHVGHMSPLSALTFMAASSGVLSMFLTYRRRDINENIPCFFAMFVIASGFIVILGYLYGTPLLYGGRVIPVALPSGAAFILTGVGMMAASGPYTLPVRIFTGPSVRSRLMRAFLPAMIVFVLIDGWLYNSAFHVSSNPALITSLIAIFSALIIGIIVSRIAISIGGEIDRAHAERERAEEMLRLDEDRLEALLKLAHFKARNEKELADFALEEGVRLTKSKGGYLHFFNEDQQTIQLYSWSKDVLKICTASSDQHYPLEKAGVWADSLRLRKPVIHNDYQTLPDKKGYPEGHFHLVRHLGIPIFDEDRIVGVAGVGNKETPYDEADARQIALFMNNMWTILKQQRLEIEKTELINELTEALASVKTLSGMLPICASCKKIRDDKGYWNQIESYISNHSEVLFSHGLCPDCVAKEMQVYEEFKRKNLKAPGV